MLHRLYKQYNVRMKVVRLRKMMPEAISLNFPKLHQELNKTMAKAIKSKKKIVFLDEVNFTKNTLLKRAYSAKG